MCGANHRLYESIYFYQALVQPDVITVEQKIISAGNHINFAIFVREETELKHLS